VVLETPEGAVLLATLPDGRPQALRYGPRAWGVQFHPETSPEVFAAWLRWDSPDGLTVAQQELLDSVTAARETLRSGWRVLAERFAAVVTDATDATDARTPATA
jgi:GMP synthase (glutamine-hydrolysing)